MPDVKVSVCGPVPVTMRFENVAAPFTALTVVVPASVAPLEIAAVIDAVAPSTTLLLASWTCTVTGGKACPEIALDGCVARKSLVGGKTTVNPLEVSGASTPDVNSTVCAPLPVTVKFENLATPFTAGTVEVPDRVPVPLAIAAVTWSVEPITMLPMASRTLTTGCVARFEPEIAPAGCN